MWVWRKLFQLVVYYAQWWWEQVSAFITHGAGTLSEFVEDDKGAVGGRGDDGGQSPQVRGEGRHVWVHRIEKREVSKDGVHQSDTSGLGRYKTADVSEIYHQRHLYHK